MPKITVNGKAVTPLPREVVLVISEEALRNRPDVRQALAAFARSAVTDGTGTTTLLIPAAAVPEFVGLW